MEKELETIFIVLEYKKNVPILDLHSTRPEEVETIVANFLLELINKNEHAAQIIYGGSGSGILKQKTIDFLNKNVREKNANYKFVKAWKEAVLEGAGGRCLVILEG